jgi:hypothetical protein
MSSLLELIARRRRASAGRRLGPPPGSVVPGLRVPAPSHTNGHDTNGHGANGNGVKGNGVNGSGVKVAEPDVALPVTVSLPVLVWPPAHEISQGLRPPLEPPQPPAEADTPPGLVARGPMRRRARYLRRLRELQLRDIGGFALELHRYGREQPELVAAKLARAAEIDRELRGLERALTGHVTLRELREAGIGGACSGCGAVHGSADRFCAACGQPLAAPAGSDTPSPDAGPPEAG